MDSAEVELHAPVRKIEQTTATDRSQECARDEFTEAVGKEGSPQLGVSSSSMASSDASVVMIESVGASPDTNESGFEQAQRLKAKGDLPGAIEAYRGVLRQEPTHGWAHHCLAQSLWWSGDHLGATEHYRHAAATLPVHQQAVPLCQLAEMQVQGRLLCAGWESLARAERRDPSCLASTDHVRVVQALAGVIAWAFDADWYAGQMEPIAGISRPDETGLTAAIDYLESGHRKGLAPHWIIDQVFLERQLDEGSTESPVLLRLLDALERGEDISPAWIVDIGWMVEQRRKAGIQTGSLLAMYRELAMDDFRTDEPTSPLFDPNWYRQVSGASDAQGSIHHYLFSGAAARLDPHPAFRSRYYADLVALAADDDPVRHYLVEGGHRTSSPNPILDLEHYAEQFPDREDDATPALLHFLALDDRDGTIPRFDRANYLAENPDIVNGRLCPEKHFLEFGSREQHRRPFRGFSSACLRSRHPAPLRYGFSDSGTYWSEQDYRRYPVLVVSHSAGRTGAPLIALRLVEELSRIEVLDVTTVVFGDGPLVKEFARYSHVITTQCGWGADVKENRAIIASFVGRSPIVSFCNSCESRHFSRDLKANGLRIVSLVHEIADHFDTPQSWGEIFELSDRVVFPSAFVKARSDVRLGSSLADGIPQPIVLPQGLLTHNFARFGNEGARRRIRDILSVPEDDVLVLGCGAKDLRKGIDLFVHCASRLLRDEGESGLHFLWLGGADAASDNDDPFYWARKALGPVAAKRLHVITSTDDVEPFYQAADLFLLSSRSDPYPCVMHEALSAGLPIVYQANSGGAAELIGERFGQAVPYEDVPAMCDAVRGLAEDRDRRKRLADAAVTHVERKCSFTDYVDELLRIAAGIGRTDKEYDLPEQWPVLSLQDLVVPPRRESMVYFLNPDWGISGINSLTESLISKLDERGLTSCLLMTRGRQTELPPDPALMPGVAMEYLNVDPDEMFPGNVHDALAAFFQRHEPCVLVPNYDYVASSQVIQLPDHVGVVGVVHSDDCEHYEHVNRVGHYWNAIIGVSDRVTRRVSELNPGYASRTVCIPNGVEPWRSAQELDDALQDQDGPIRLVYTGRLVHPQKRVERYVELVRQLDAQGIDYVFEFVGAGEAEDWLRSTLAAQLAAGRAVLHGRCTPDRTREIVCRADVFTLFSDFEGMPMSLLEALGAGCIPLVYEMDSGLDDFIEQGVNGHVCRSRTVEEAVRVVAGLVDPTARRHMRMAARQLLDARGLTADAMADAYADVIGPALQQSCTESFERPRWIHTR